MVIFMNYSPFKKLLTVTIYFVYLNIPHTESSRCNKIKAAIYHYHCTPCGGFFMYKYKRYIPRFRTPEQGAFKINSFYFYFAF